VIDNELALMTITSIIATGLFILTIGIDVDSSAFAKKYNTQTVTQINNCGNHLLPTNVICSNFGLNSDEHESINNIVGHSFLPFPQNIWVSYIL
jgi:hypothetical protein